MTKITAAGGKFSLGQMILTAGVNDRVADDESFSKFVTGSLGRHARGDWGNLSADDVKENEYSIDRHLRLLSAYEQEDSPKIWIITEADRSATTVLFPAEY